MKRTPSRFLGTSLTLACKALTVGLSTAQSTPPPPHPNPSQAHPTVLESLEYLGTPAFRLSNGITEAVIVPAFSARIMRYGTVGGRNWLWNSSPKPKGGKWTNLGGDKCFIGPHCAWTQFAPTLWPPHFPSWDGDPHMPTQLPGPKLRTSGPLWNGFEARIIREFSFDHSGALVIEQHIEKQGDAPVPMAAWTVSQALPPEAVFIPLNPKSPYAGGFHTFGPLPPEASLERLSPSLLRLRPTTGNSYKIGSDSQLPAILAVAQGTAWLQRADPQPGSYPDGVDGPGFPIEYYNHGAAGLGQYVELEFLSPQLTLKKAQSLSLTVRWSLHPLTTKNPSADSCPAEIQALLSAPLSSTPPSK